MADRFYVEPASVLPGFQMLAAGIGARAEFEREKAEAARQQAVRTEAAGIIQTGTPEQISSFMIQNPWLQKDITTAIETGTRLERQEMSDAYERVLYGNEPISKVGIEIADMIQARGGDISGMIGIIETAQTDPEAAKRELEKGYAMYATKDEWERYQSFTKPDIGKVSDPAEMQFFKYLTEKMTPEQVEEAKRIRLGLSPRATEEAAVKAEKAFAQEAGKLQAREKFEPGVAGAVVSAKKQAEAQVKELGEKKSSKVAWDVYNTAMTDLAASMAGTATGPFVGFIPAITANAQIAEGSMAVMAPVLKQMFRAAGEGIFTDKDQELLMKMVPTRKDLPEARIAKITAIDAVVRAKLGITEGITGERPEMPAPERPTITPSVAPPAFQPGAQPAELPAEQPRVRRFAVPEAVAPPEISRMTDEDIERELKELGVTFGD